MSSLTRRRHDATGRSKGTFADSRFSKANRPPEGEGWIWLTRDMLESYAWRALSSGAFAVLSRVLLEHMAHGGTQNGQLPVTYSNIEEFGVRREIIHRSIAEAEALGFLERTHKGAKAWGELQGVPGQYRITWLPTCDGEPATNEWRRFTSAEEAEHAVKITRQQIAGKRRRPPVDHQSTTSAAG